MSAIIPPNLLPVSNILDNEDYYFPHPEFTPLLCPVCGFNCNHIGEIRTIPGNDGYEAWYGRGDLTVIPYSGECGSEWEICFGFHKGVSSIFVRVKISCTEQSFLYFIEAVGTGFIKIGRSSNPELRLKQLSTGSPNDLVIIGAISGGSKVESELHRQFSFLRERGEWFKATDELRNFIMQATN